MVAEPVSLNQPPDDGAPDDTAPKRQRRRLAAVYGVLALGWVALSHVLIPRWLDRPDDVRLASTLASVGLVLVSAALLCLVVHRQLRHELALTRARRKASARHRAARQLLEAIVSKSTDAIFAKDLDGRYLLMNAQALRVAGKTEQEVIGHTDDALYPEEMARSIRKNDQQVLREQVAIESEHIVRGAQGPQVFFAVKAPLVDSRGNVVGLFGISRDITDRRRMNQALRESEARYRTMIEQSPDAIVVHRAGRILYANPAALRMAGVATAEEALGRRVLDFAPVDSRDEIGRLTRELFTSRNGWEVVEVQVRRSDGSVIDVAVRGSAIEFDGAAAVQIAMRDISGRKRAQRALQASEAQLRSALNDKDALLREVHHRVKNNLQVIDSLLRMETRRSGQEETRAVLQDMQGRIRAMAQLHESLFRSGAIIGIDLAAYLGQLVNRTLQAQAPRPGVVRLQLDLDPVQVEMDQATPCGLLVNELVSNCLKHGFADGRGGEVRVSLKRQPGSTALVLLVEDNGQGLAQDWPARKQRALGLQLADDLAGQLGGELLMGPGPVAVFTLQFDASPPRAVPSLAQA